MSKIYKESLKFNNSVKLTQLFKSVQKILKDGSQKITHQ